MSEIIIAIFINPLAGNGKYHRTETGIRQYLKKEKIKFVVYDQYWPSQLDSFSHVFIVGGDGTINYFLNSFPDTKIPVSVFKAGTGNDFAWKLYGNLNFIEQLNTAVHGVPHAVDAGICNGRYFINGVGLGFDGAVVKNFINCRKWLKGKFGYYWTVVRTLSGYQSKELSVVIDGDREQLTSRFFMITVANGSRFGGNFMVAPQSSLTDKQLDLVMIKAVPVLKRYFYLPKMKKGRHLSLPFVRTMKINSICIAAPKPLAAHLDGELMVADKFDITILPGHFLFRY
ncbi:MAG: YegS/Rv2252/BmrU family lipid kinase [Chitinophagaceae bacterium]|nr:MAG: YegS/Rv2252/BmrU family lipid kinase [Chitinophagaceae bacterium]